MSFKYARFQDKECKVHKLHKTFQAGALNVGAEQDPTGEHGCAPKLLWWLDGCLAHPEYETWKLTAPLSLQLDLGLDASMHLSLRSAKLWQIQKQHKLSHVTNWLNGVVSL